MKKVITAGIIALLVTGGLAGVYVLMNLRQANKVATVDQTGFSQSALDESLQLQKEISENARKTEDEQAISVKRVRSGSFSKFDPAHYANGQAVIYETEDGPILKFEDFETPNGPDLFVYLVTNDEITGIKTDRGAEVSLGELKSITGDQVYKLPDNYQDYGSVVIWCRAFDINFSAASLEEI